jgi:hypothetical protein
MRLSGRREANVEDPGFAISSKEDKARISILTRSKLPKKKIEKHEDHKQCCKRE